ncbi:MAG: PAS domain-containing protein [Deltaproteobacteria bacterium]|nr:PAS domain-containing protein [Deltaproteobacteria bacterium]MDQ3296209.1 ATP-binding protein [Myxococcota bacterium]
MIRRARTRVLVLALALALTAGIVTALLVDDELHVLHSYASAAPYAAAIAAGVIALAAGGLAISSVRRSLRELEQVTRDVARDTTRRIPPLIAPRDDEVRQLAEWVNFLAEDANRSHQALARERVLLSAVADGINQGVIAVDSDHKIELLNDAARGMLGVSSSPLGEPLIEFVRVPQLFELLEADEAATTEVQLASGVRAVIRSAQKWGGEGRVLLLEDVTTMRRLETVRRDFVANVSHELRTPVAVIRANAETLLSGAKDDPAIAPRLIEGLHRNAERLARILADLLDLSRLDAGQYRLDVGRVPLRAAFEQALTAIETQAAARGVIIEVTVTDDLVVKADPKALDQILVNLIDNAVKYTRQDGHVWIEAKPAGAKVRVEIRDDGPGIADRHRERVFERFYRADPSRSRDAGGTGLGLSIVKHLVESMNGEVGVRPNRPRGSIFWLQLPAAPGPAAESEPS